LVVVFGVWAGWGPRAGKTVGSRYGDWSLAIYAQPTFDAIAAATAIPRPDPSALVRGRPSYRLPRFASLSPALAAE
jgi:hypothetical protein